MGTQTGPFAELLRRVAVLESQASAARSTNFRHPNQFALGRVVGPSVGNLPPAAGVAAFLDFVDVIPVDVVEQPGQSPEMIDRQTVAIRVKNSQVDVSPGDLVGMALGTDGTWWIVAVYPHQGRQANVCCGCSPTECFDFQFWQVENGCPRYFALTVDDDIGCCNGDAGGTHILEYTAATDTDPAMWRGPNFECGTAGDDCGTGTWTWEAAANCGSVTYTWTADDGDCAISTANVTWQPGPWYNCSAGSWVPSTSCGEGCEPDLSSLDGYVPPNPCSSQSITRPCVPVAGAQWVASGSCNCGTAPEPAQAGEYIGQTVTVPCDYTGDPGQWVLTDDQCSCGEPVAPSEPGVVAGEARITNCVDQDAAPDCGTSSWERIECTFTGISGSCGQTGVSVAWVECTLLTTESEDPRCAGIAQTLIQYGGPAGNVYGYRTASGEWVGMRPGETVTKAAWVLVSDDCTCGMAIPPRQDLYAPAGTILTRSCESPLLAYWRLIPPIGYAPAEVQFVVDGIIKIRYRLPYLRSYCCKCQMRFDVVVGDPCSFPCRGVPQSVCLRPIRSGPPGGSCRDYSPVYSLYVEGFEEWPCRDDSSDACAERQSLLDGEADDWPVQHGGHPIAANGSFLLALTHRACCGNAITDPDQADTCESLACEWWSEPTTQGEVCTGSAGTSYCVDGSRVSGAGSCVPESEGGSPTRLCETAWTTSGAGRWFLRNFTESAGVTVCGDGLKLYLHTGGRGDNATPYPGSAERYDYWDTLDDGSILFRYNVTVANQDKFPQYVMLVPVTDI